MSLLFYLELQGPSGLGFGQSVRVLQRLSHSGFPSSQDEIQVKQATMAQRMEQNKQRCTLECLVGHCD
uniref:Uncharacterized protein n=1 Tax=Setaria italica TaxID=4555 RepID=K3ZBJ8_SETIT